MSGTPLSLFPMDDNASFAGASSDDDSNDAPVNPISENRMVGWNISDERSTASTKSFRKIRPMHIRLSVRVHHISFLHPGLDTGGSTLTTNRGKTKKLWLPKKRSASMKATGPMAFGKRKGSWKNPSKSKMMKKNSKIDDSKHHEGYMDEDPVASAAYAAEVTDIISSETFRLSRDGIIQQHYALTNTAQQQVSSSGVTCIKGSELSETARYYKECAARPKGYRRVIVSSMFPLDDDNIPPPVKSQNRLLCTKSTTPDDEKGDPFDHVEYRHIGPPNTGPAFFQLLRKHGAAHFGRFLPEVACSVPKHSICFELRKSKGIKRQGASTQPFVIEAPHVIWGEARDKTLSRVANEGCPLIDAREFEYVSNANLKDTELTETLMVCGATVWVKNATDDDISVGNVSKLQSSHTKNMAKAEYYRGKIADGVKSGAVGIAKGVIDAGKILSPYKVKANDASARVALSNLNTQESKKKKKRVKFGVKQKFTKKNSLGDDVMSLSSVHSGSDDAFIASVTNEPELLTDSASMIPRTLFHERAENSPPHIVKSVPYVLIEDDVINIKIVSYPDANEVIAKFPISVASVLAQRNIEERLDDPLKPSELTATLIQEPCAPKMQWGVELKVTVRAVEVKPELPRTVFPDMATSISASMDTLQNEVKNTKDTMRSLGKTQSEIDDAVQKKEKEISDREVTLNQAIITAGLGHGEYGGLNPEEVHKHQMFYDEDEHKLIERKMKMRCPLLISQQNLLKDAQLSPLASQRSNVYDNEEKILKLLSAHFSSINDRSVTKAKDIRVSVTLAIAESLDNELGEYLDESTVELIQQSVRQQNSLGHSHDGQQMSAFEVKEWCYDLASKLSLSSSKGTQSKRSISHIQNVLILSIGGTEAGNIVHPKSEDEVEEEVPPDVIDVVNGWCMTVLSKLDSCAEELTYHEDDEPTQFSFQGVQLDDTTASDVRSVAQSSGVKKIMKQTELDSVMDYNSAPQEEQSNTNVTSNDTNESFVLSLPKMTTKNRDDVNDSDNFGSEKDIWTQTASQKESDRVNSGTLQRALGASKLATFNEVVNGRASIPTRQIEHRLKNMRDLHFRNHGNKGKGSISSPRKPTEVSGNDNVVRTCNRLSYLVAIVIVSVATAIAMKYYDIIIVT